MKPYTRRTVLALAVLALVVLVSCAVDRASESSDWQADTIEELRLENKMLREHIRSNRDGFLVERPS